MSDIVGLQTGNVNRAGTDLDVQISLYRGGIPVTDYFTLDRPGVDDRERGQYDTYDIPVRVGSLSGISLRVKHEPAHVNDEPSYDAWYLETVDVTTTDDTGRRVTCVFGFHAWITVPQGDPNWHVISDFRFEGTVIHGLAFGPISTAALERFLPTNTTKCK
jgi:PLAT/LH2 domain